MYAVNRNLNSRFLEDMNMQDDYGKEVIVLTDEDGNEADFEIVDMVEYQGEEYVAMIPCELNLEEEAEVVIMHVDADDMLVAVEDDELADAIYEQVMDNIDEALYAREAEAETDDE
jgi:uncharacterized protein YrzB (UPF0473 family)